MLKKAALAVALLSASSAHAADRIGTVFVIALENHNFTQPAAYTSLQPIYGNPAAPYINSLLTPGDPNAAMVSYASNYVNVPPQPVGSPSGPGAVHPSEPNYIWAEAGIAGPRNDNQPYPSNIVNAPSLSATLQADGQTWRSYQEDIDLARNSSNQPTNTVVPKDQYVVPLQNFSGSSPDYVNPYNGSHQYDYATKHDPELFFTATNGGNNTTPANPLAVDYAPLQQLQTDLAGNTVAQYNWITPDQFNDMHTTLSGGFTYNGVHYTGDSARIAQGDNFLAQLVPMIEASQAFQNNGLIVIWNDETEGEGSVPGLFTSTEIVISPLAKGNAYTNSILYDHSSDLRTMQQIFNVDPAHGFGYLGGAATATDLSDLFRAGAVASVPEPQTWALALIGFGAAGTALRRQRRMAGGTFAA